MGIEFRNRAEAGTQLARLLIRYSREDAVILVPMDGSIIIGKTVSNTLATPLDLVMASPVPHPERWDEIIGVVSHDNFAPPVAGEDHGSHLEQMLPRIRKRLTERALFIKNGTPPLDLTGKVVIVITQGIRTGHKLFHSLQLVSTKQPAKIVVAAPVIAPETIPLITSASHEIHGLFTPMPYYRTDSFYRHFEFLDDEALAAVFAGSKQFE